MKNSFFYLLIVLIPFFSCKKEEKYPVLLIGHGAVGLATSTSPMHSNTKEAVDYAFSLQGIDGVEIDIQLSKDGTLWLYHDNFLNQEANGSACVNSSTDTEIEKIRYRIKGKPFLTKLNDISNPNNKYILLDLKSKNYCSNSSSDLSQFAIALQPFIDQQDSSKIALLINSMEEFNAFSGLKCQKILNASSKEQFLAYAALANFDGMCVNNKFISKTEISDLKTLGYSTFLYELRSPKEIKNALKKNPSGILSDDLRLSIKAKYR